MKTKQVTLLGLAVSLFFAVSARAGTIAATPADQPIMPGEWHLSLAKALAVAQETGIPVLGFWSNTGCSRCSEVIDQAVNTPAFTAWRKQKQLLMVTGEGKTGRKVMHIQISSISTLERSICLLRKSLYMKAKDCNIFRRLR